MKQGSCPGDGTIDIFTDLLKQNRIPLILYDNVVINHEAEVKDDFLYFRHYSSSLIIGYDSDSGKMLLSRREVGSGSFRQYTLDDYKSAINVKLMPLAINRKYYVLNGLTEEKKNEIKSNEFEYAKKSLLNCIDDYFSNVITDRKFFQESVELYGTDIFVRFNMGSGEYFGGTEAYEKIIDYISCLKAEISDAKPNSANKLFMLKLALTSVEMKISPTFYFIDLYHALQDFQSVSPDSFADICQSAARGGACGIEC